ncbi:MAG: hypothetical protein JWP19_2040 [Rhodoglobus sp.]|jgi:hypothetical protein|nr:hypothetical protein [Rhodoglobus sp.]
MAEREEHLDALASAENRRDTRRAVIITLVALTTVVLASLLVVLGGVHS